MAKPVYRVIGVQGVLEVYETKVKITPKGCLAFLNFGFKGAKTIPFSSISGLEVKSSGVTRGYIQFTLRSRPGWASPGRSRSRPPPARPASRWSTRASRA